MFRLRFKASGSSAGGNGKEIVTVADWMPAVDISETAIEYAIKAELPEVKKEDVTVENDVLTIQGERKQEKEQSGKTYHRIERPYGRFVRSFTLPNTVDGGKVRAEYADGMLTLHLPNPKKRSRNRSM
ncbi:MAG: Heat shock protein Hsp20 family [Nitrospira sp.]|nr:Heat shock protein Hsp20 family [Nitrospira sp.]